MNYLLTFLEGLASFLSPCVLPLVPVYAIYFAGTDGGKGRTALNAGAYVCGLITVFALLGLFAGSVGAALRTPWAARAAGGAVILLGLLSLVESRFSIGFRHGGAGRLTGAGPAFLFGFLTPVVACACIGPFLGAALVTAAGSERVTDGVLLLVAYALGLGLPFFVSALAIDRVKGLLGFLSANHRRVRIVSAALLVLAGAYLLIEGGLPHFGSREAPRSSVAAQAVPENALIELNVTNYVNEVLRGKGLMLVDFRADWCGPCRQLAPVIEEVLAEHPNRFRVGKVNVDESPAIAARYGVRQLPALILFRDGKIIDQSLGFLPKKALEAFLGL